MKHKSYEDQIEEIMAWFDFTNVENTMQLSGWAWADVGIPDRGMIRKHAKEMLLRVSSDENPIRKTCSGGLEAENNDGWLSLRFVVEDWNCCP